MQQPLQYFFVADKNVVFEPLKTQKKNETAEFDFGSNKINVRLFPVAKNQIIARFDNLADAFDKDNEDVEFDV